jgi:anti-sigma B factor antagonist
MDPISPESQDLGGSDQLQGGAAADPLESTQPRPRFVIDVVRTARAAVVTLTGDFDVVCADAFKRRMADATADEPPHVVIDLRALTFIDSTGLAMLLRVNEMSRDQDFALWIVSGEDDPPFKIFRMTGTTSILPIVGEPPDFVTT